MKVINLNQDSNVYTSNAYLVLGTWNTLDDVNTLVDVGRDSTIFERLEQIHTGVGKKKLDQVILTHSHFDHSELVSEFKKRYSLKILAFSRSVAHIDQKLYSDNVVQMGDRKFVVFNCPAHSADSIMLYNEEEGVLFAGDTPLVIRTPDQPYADPFASILRTLSKKPLNIIYPGHGAPLTENLNKLIFTSYTNVVEANKNKK